MKKSIMFMLIFIISTCIVSAQFNYPVTKKVNQVDTFFGVKVKDPYRWFENDSSQEVKDWVKEQNKITTAYLQKIPFREKIRQRISDLYNNVYYTSPRHVGEYYFFSKNAGLQPQFVIYRKKGLQGNEEVFFDPNLLSKDGTTRASLLSYSENKQYIIIVLHKAGSDWSDAGVYEVATGKKLDDHLDGVKNSGFSWKGNGFYYSRYPLAPKGKELTNINEHQKVYYHLIGTPQADDKLVFETKDNPLSFNGAYCTEDKRFLFVNSFSGKNNTDIYYRDFQSPDTSLKLLIKGKDNTDESVIDNSGNMIILQTNRGAPGFKVVMVDPANPAISNWKTIIPERKEAMTDVNTAGGKLFVTYLKDVISRVYQYDYAGHLEKEIQLPDVGTAGGFGGLHSDPDVYYSFTSYLYPNTIFKYNIPTGKSELFFKLRRKIDPADYESKEIFYTSKDGTKVPLFIIYKKGLVKDSSHPALLYAYGGYAINMLPYFNPAIFPLLDAGGIYAVANIRGGGEYGEKWHEAGMLLNTQNRFDDFIAAAEWLIKEKYTSPSKLGIAGGSHGGCLVGSVMLQRPDLFKVAMPQVGTLDMLRFQKFTVGWNWTREYGNPDSAADFKNLIAYSPVHNVKQGVQYPATLVMTADHDDRVVPMHSFKFISQLQANQAGSNPVIIRIDTNSGHGGSSLIKWIDDETEQMAFLLYNTNSFPKE